MNIKEILETKEGKEFWDGVDEACLEVQAWPKWKKDMSIVCSKEDLPVEGKLSRDDLCWLCGSGDYRQ